MDRLNSCIVFASSTRCIFGYILSVNQFQSYVALTRLGCKSTV